ncbi:9807_t:CDS:1, partial [Cetraspora pellucida]
MKKNKTSQESFSYLLNEHIKYLRRYLRRLELREPSKNSVLWNFINDEIEVTKRHKEQVDESKKITDYGREIRVYNREITHLQRTIKELEKVIKELHERNEQIRKENDDYIKTLREENNIQKNYISTIEYDLMKVVEEKNNLEKDNLKL